MKATVNVTSGLNIRKEPRAGAEVIREAAYGEELNVSLVHDGWCTCEDGFCMCKFVDIIDGEKAEETSDKPVSAHDEGDQAPEGASAHDAAKETATGDEAAELNKLKVPELIKLAKDSGIEVKAGANKGELIEAILNAD